MKIYNYNQITKEYLSTTQASKNPLEEGKYLIPANATTIAIGVDKAGFAQVFNEANKKWGYVKDNRSKTVYDTTTKEESQVDYMGVIKSGFTELIPKVNDKWNGNSWVLDIVLAIDIKKAEINTACATQITSGFTSLALGTTRTYKSKELDQLNLIGVVTGGTDDYFKCAKTVSGKLVWSYEMHTSVQLKQVLNDGKAHKQVLLQKAGTLKAKVDLAKTQAELDLIVW